MNLATMENPDAAAQALPSELVQHDIAILRHSAELQRARANLESDKAARRGSLLASLVDALSRTVPEEAHAVAQARLQSATAAAKPAVVSWVVARAQQSLRQASHDSEIYDSHERRRASTLEQLTEVRRLSELARTAYSRLSDAQSACSSASSTEVLDAFTDSKMVSMMSSAATSSASSAIKAAQSAVQALEEGIQKANLRSPIDQPSDMLDTILDFALPGAIDFTSFLNASRLDRCEEQCVEAKRKIRPIKEAYASRVAQLEADKVQAEADMRRIEVRHITATTAALPETLLPLAPASFHD